MSKQVSTSATAAARRTVILDRPLNRTRTSEVSLSAFAFLFSEMMQYTQKRVNGIQDLERKLSDYGYRVGIRYHELTQHRDRSTKRDQRILNILYMIHTGLWKHVFGKQADSLEKGTDNEDEYMISDNDPIITKYISVPRDMSTLNCGAFIAGIVESILDASQFPARVTAHSTGTDQYPTRMTILIKFDQSVMLRERALESSK